MENITVMVGSAGRRVYLLDFFRQAAKELGVQIQLHVTENDRYAATTFKADQVHLLPRFDDPFYTEEWLHTVKVVEPDLYFSVNDYEVAYLSERAPLDQLPDNTVLPHLKADKFALTLDKYLLSQKLQQAGIATAPTALLSHVQDFTKAYDSDQYVVKDRFGSGSSGLRIVNLEDLQSLSRSERNPQALVVQPRLDGEEYGVDVVSALKGRGDFKAALVRKKLGMHSGETDKAVSKDPGEFTDLAKSLANFLGSQGVIDTDVFMTSQGPVLIDINPRFGGGYPFSHAAGANVPLAYLREILGKSPEPEDYRYEAEVYAAKYPALAVAKPGR
ncbi:MAG: ATP-grasp domain-containing protein [Actinomycetaceae bacterium]|nr:ATP-grasp domain-containing protein [Actinomycetaceae bacterium]